MEKSPRPDQGSTKYDGSKISPYGTYFYQPTEDQTLFGEFSGIKNSKPPVPEQVDGASSIYGKKIYLDKFLDILYISLIFGGNSDEENSCSCCRIVTLGYRFLSFLIGAGLVCVGVELMINRPNFIKFLGK